MAHERKNHGGTQTKANLAHVEKFLKDLDYPAMKNEVIECARGNDAPEDVIQMLEQIPEQEYGSPTEISREIGKAVNE